MLNPSWSPAASAGRACSGSHARSFARPADRVASSTSASQSGDALPGFTLAYRTWGRLNAARDLRLLLRSESQGQIEAIGASFGDAAASYFAMIDEHEPDVNHDALDCSKASDGKEYVRASVQHDAVSGGDAGRVTGAHGGDARDTQ